MIRTTSIHTTLVLVLISLSSTPVLSDEPPDYSKGFARFEQLGLPNVSTAAYVRLTSYDVWTDSLLPSRDYYETSGNAWMLTETRDPRGRPTRGTFVVSGGNVLEVFWRRNGEETDDPVDTESSQSTSGRVRGSWRPARLEHDTRLIDRSFQELQGKPSWRIHLGDACQGQLLLFAAQLHQRGDVKTANRIAESLFKLVPDRAQVIRSAVNCLADGQYENLYRRFLGNHDWRAYHDGIRELISRFPSGWEKMPGMQELLNRVERRLTDPPPTPSVTNGFTETDFLLAARLLNIREIQVRGDYMRRGTFWLLPESWLPASSPTNVDLAICAKGMKTIPFLLALSQDRALTDMDAKTFRDGSWRFLSTEGHSLDVIWQKMNRPATRGDVSVEILSAILPQDLSSQWDSSAAGDMIAELAKTFYGLYGNRSSEEVAVRFLQDRYSSPNRTASDFLLQQATHRRLPVFEEFLVSGMTQQRDGSQENTRNTLEWRSELLLHYTIIRGEETRPLVQKMTNSVWEGILDLKRRESGMFRQLKEERSSDEWRCSVLMGAISNFTANPPGTSLDDLLGRYTATDNRNFGRHEEDLLFSHLVGMRVADVVRILLRKAAETDDPTNRVVIGNLATDALYRKSQEGRMPFSWAPTKRMTAVSTNHWDVLIADNRKGGKPAQTVCDLFLCLNEELFADPPKIRPSRSFSGWFHDDAEYPFGPAGMRARRTIEDLEPSGREFVRERVSARLSGVPEEKLPQYPEDRPLPSADRAALESRLAKVTSREECVTLIEGLSIFERAALPEILRRAPALNQKLLLLANTIAGIEVEDPTLRGRLSVWRSRMPNTLLLRELHDYCMNQAKTNQTTTCLLLREKDFGGCRLSVTRTAQMTKRDRSPNNRTTDPKPPIQGVSGLVCAPGIYGSARWRTASMPAKPDWNTLRSSDKDILDTFDRAMDSFCSTNVLACSAGVVKFQTQGDER